MYLKRTKQKSGRIYLSIADGVWDKKRGHSKTITIKSLGYLDELEKEYEDPITHFQEIVKQMNLVKAAEKAPINLSVNPLEKIDPTTTNRKNFGYAVLSRIYHELGVGTFLINRQRHLKADYNANNIMKLLVYSRLLEPASKKKTHENKGMFFENTDFSLDAVYRFLPFLNSHREELQLWIHKRIQDLYKRDTKLVYYDVTNYYFEIDEEDEFRRDGVSKEHRPDPIVQMGLFCDANGIPITYDLHPGNTPDKSTYRPTLKKILHDYDLGKIIVVADRGVITADNIIYTLSAKNGYVFSRTVRGADKEFKDWVLDESGYEAKNGDFKVKSRLYPRTIKTTGTFGGKIDKTVHEKHVVFYSQKYADKAKAERAPAVEKAKELIKNPGRYNKSTSKGAAKYVKNITFDKKTGEVLVDANQYLSFNEEKLKKEEQYDGYYAIVTSEVEESADRIIEIYRGLWKIEEAFKLTKSDFEARPVYLSKTEHINAHFLTCFVALVIARILEHRTKHKHSVTSMLESLRKASCSHVQDNYYIFDHFDEVLADLGKEFEIDFSKKYMRLGEIKKVLGDTKKV